MTISTTNSRNDYTASSSQTTFAYTFPVTAESDILVYQDTVLKSITTHYTISATPTGNVVFGTGLASGVKVAIVRSLPLTQSSDYVENDPFSAETHEDALDRLTIIAQQIDEEVGRSLKLAAPSTTTNLNIPEPSADKYLAWNSAADALENKDIADISLLPIPVSIADGGTGETTAVAARTALGVNKGTTIESETPTVTATGNFFDVTGTTTIAALTAAVNRQFFLRFLGVLQLTHHATNLDLPGEANITTAVGDVAEFFSHTANQVQCVAYTKASGEAVVGGAGGGPSKGTGAYIGTIRTNPANIQENITLSDHSSSFTAANASNTINNRGTDDGFVDGDMVQLLGSDLPNGWFIDTQYFVRDATSSSLKLALTFGGTAVTISDDGSSTRTIYQNINGMSAGPITISEDTVTIPSGSTWSII